MELFCNRPPQTKRKKVNNTLDTDIVSDEEPSSSVAQPAAKKPRTASPLTSELTDGAATDAELPDSSCATKESSTDVNPSGDFVAPSSSPIVPVLKKVDSGNNLYSFQIH